ncbi:MAG: L-arabinose isomerase [Bombilactobacillus mellifer]|uniref:L-arabinose isomerase n=1 Tax=Bombilactobacillus mellifer TaxID=1218492 RepID=UPI0018DC554D|nr:L-arabinose isomerase [Bombilactobacillus mellifer]MBH9990805.1 L-arabinose isomerase [Lactobacillus sp. W8092]MCT6825790.1 L-arabinose isomerase [Bombilactobacillus mellifer]MCT6844169.1 L-arabinose isomerase [Bombilactobacillus mellifer]MCT6894932.1 L-arabinose isomerase [Bombilactobacillus mellifer]
MLEVPQYEFWFAVGSQHLYGEETLREVADDAKKIVAGLNENGNLPYPIVFKEVLTTADEITKFMKEVNYQDKVAGVITWMHTFSPAKNWIRGTKLLQKPLLHFATQFLNYIPYDTIDFDYMNLNQSAHGDREYGYINARLQKHNKIIYGHWQDPAIMQQIADWEDVAVAYDESFKLKVCRFGDTMRNVAVTEGDKVQAQIQLGWTVDYYGVGDLVAEINKVQESEIDEQYADLKSKYTLVPGDMDESAYQKTVRYQLKQYIAMKRFFERGGYSAFTSNFEDLHGLEQLQGLSAQLLMRDGYGFAGEGDWKTAALLRTFKIMTHNQKTAFMEDYTLDLRPGHEAILGSHMLEVDPSIASEKPRVEVHPLDIGNKADPARLVFSGLEGDAIDVTLADFRNNFKLVTYAVDAHQAEKETPHLPVAKQMWTPKVGLKQGATQWIQAGGGHHTVFSFAASEEQVSDLAKMYGVDLCSIQ